MKKVLYIIAVILVLLSVTNLIVFADENAENTVNEPTAVEPTLTDRLYEWFTANFAECMTSIGVALSAIFLTVVMPFLRSKITAVKSNIDSSMLEVVKSITSNTSNVSNIVGALNTLIDKYNALETSLRDFETKQAERDAQSAETMAKKDSDSKKIGILTETIIDMLSTVYANSRNLPQGVKDMLALKHSKALKEIEVANDVKANEG